MTTEERSETTEAAARRRQAGDDDGYTDVMQPGEVRKVGDIEVMMPRDAVLEVMQETGHLPPNWWTSQGAWQMLGKLCDNFAESSMVPADYRNAPQNVMVAMAAGLPLGLSPLACVQSVAVINGRPTLYGDAPIAQVLAHSSLKSIKEVATGTIEKGDREHTITITRTLPSGELREVTRSFSIGDAKRAGLWSKAGPWSNYPDRMLYNRARAFAVRDSFADVLQGVTLAADDTDEEIKPVEATVTTPPAETAVDQTASLAPTPAPVDTDEKQAKKKKPTKAQQKKMDAAAAELKASNEAADEQAAAAADAAPAGKTVMSAKGPVVLKEWAHDMSDLVVGGVAIDTIDGTIHHCDGEGWREIKPENASLWNYCSDFIGEQIAKWLTKHCKAKRMEAADAMKWAQDILKLEKPPAKFMALTLTKLAELWHEAR